MPEGVSRAVLSFSRLSRTITDDQGRNAHEVRQLIGIWEAIANRSETWGRKNEKTESNRMSIAMAQRGLRYVCIILICTSERTSQ